MRFWNKRIDLVLLDVHPFVEGNGKRCGIITVSMPLNRTEGIFSGTEEFPVEKFHPISNVKKKSIGVLSSTYRVIC